MLHSYELLALLVALAWLTNWVPLWGYVLGVTLHLPLDIFFNGRMLSRNLVPFYSIAYRWRLGFRAGPLLGLAIQRSAGSFWRSFFAEFFPRPPIRASGRRFFGARSGSSRRPWGCARSDQLAVDPDLKGPDARRRPMAAREA